MRRIIDEYKYYVGIFILVAILFLTNYRPATYLTGWDNLQTELYPWLAIKRAFFAVWQEYQSFGLVSGMAHAADLIRATFMWVLSFFLPQNLQRYFYHFFMLLLGGWGELALLTNLGILRKFAFLGSIFYLLNFGTVQYFYLPYEPFSHFWASLPWLIWSYFKMIRNFNKKNILIFFIANLLATPSFYVQTLFLVYGFIITILNLFYLCENKNNIKKILVMGFLIITIDSFWLIPQLYFLKTASHNVREAKINQMSNETTINQNISRGNLIDFLTFKGFYFDLLDNSGNPLFNAWQEHLNDPITSIIQLILFLISFGGLFAKNKYKKFFAALLFLNSVFLLTNTFGYKQINQIIRSDKLISQIFRSSFTKFIPSHSLVMTYFFTLGLVFVVGKSRLNAIFIAILIFFYSLPSFSGNFISPALKINIPKEYSEIMTYFKSVDKNTRIALFPDYTYWGWFLHKWGYYGSGFLWYGIEQPIVSRTFDVWSEKSESYFWEIRTAIMKYDRDLFNKILAKYKIKFIIFDRSLLPIASSYKAMQLETLEDLLQNSSQLTKVKSFGTVDIYSNLSENLISGLEIKNLPDLGPKIKLTNEDTAFTENGAYFTSTDNTIYYPFLDLQTFTILNKKNWRVSEQENNIIVQTVLPQNINAVYKLVTLSVNKPYLFFYNDQLKELNFTPLITRKDNNLIIEIPKYSLLSNNFSLVTTNNCPENPQEQKISFINNQLITFSKNGRKICFGYHLQNLPQEYGYLIKIKSKNITGDKLFFYVLDHTNKQAIIENRLSNGVNYFVLPPVFSQGIGYSFNFNNTSYHNLKSENILEQFDIYPLPYEFLKSLKFVKKDSPEVKKKVLIYNQVYSDGWKAYQIECQNSNLKCQISTVLPFFFGQELKNHVLVNNWANGWEINSEICNAEHKTCQIVILFWPQYLEFLGFGLMISSFVFLLKSKRTKQNKLTAIKNSNQKPFLLKTLLTK